MLLYELLILDSSDPVYNPIWRQGSYVMPFTSHLGIIQSNHRWSLSMSQESPLYWSYEWVINIACDVIRSTDPVWLLALVLF